LVGITTFVAWMLVIVGVMEGGQVIGLSRDVAEAVLAIVLAGVAWWIMRDAKRIAYHEYASEIALRPSWVAILILVASPLALPWYAADRYRIARGTLPRKAPAAGGLGLRD
jgi:hypothetical protein